MPQRTCLAVVLAAGEGTRMRTSLPKALHELGGRTLLAHVLGAVSGADVALVVGPDHGALEAAAKKLVPAARIYVQHERLGTAHAVLAAKAALVGKHDDILVMFADTPLVRAETLTQLRGALAEGAAV